MRKAELYKIIETLACYIADQRGDLGYDSEYVAPLYKLSAKAAADPPGKGKRVKRAWRRVKKRALWY